jgi:hypothetical protein
MRRSQSRGSLGSPGKKYKRGRGHVRRGVDGLMIHSWAQEQGLGMGLPVGRSPIGDGDGIVRLGCVATTFFFFLRCDCCAAEGGRVENAEEYLSTT